MKIPYFKAKLEYQRQVEKAKKNEETEKQIRDQQELYRNKTFAQVAAKDDFQQQILKTLEILQRKIENIEKKQQVNQSQTSKRKKRPSETNNSTTTSEETDFEPTETQQSINEQTETTSQVIKTIADIYNHIADVDISTFSESACGSQEIVMSSEIIPETQQTNPTCGTRPKMAPTIIQQQKEQHPNDKFNDSMDYEDEKKELKRTNRTRTVHKTSPYDGKKKKTPNT
jgi:hypothetical protein